jgi:hypothetical protein
VAADRREVAARLEGLAARLEPPVRDGPDWEEAERQRAVERIREAQANLNASGCMRCGAT